VERNTDKRAADSRSQQVRLIELELDDLQRRQQLAIERLYQLRKPPPRTAPRSRLAAP
jgi:hypothetical protein